MTDLSTLDVKEILREDSLPEYEKGMNFFYSQLVHLNTTIYILDQIIKFPFKLFVVPDKTIFFNVVIRNSFDAGILIVTRLATDQGNDLYTLIHFKSRVRELIKSELIDLFDERLRKYRFDKRIATLLTKVKKLRDERVGHAKQDVVLGVSEGAQMDFSELKSLRDALNSLLQALSFNMYYMMLPVPYDPQVQHPVGSNHQTDIEEILDSIALNSAVLQMPEKNPTKWTHWRTEFTDFEIGQINSYRRKFGLPEA